MVPSGENPTDHTGPVWLVRVRSSRPVAVSHNRTVPSPPPEAIMVASGEKATAYCGEDADRSITCAGSRPATAATASSGASRAEPRRPPRTPARDHRLPISTAPVRSVSTKRAPRRSTPVRSAPASPAPVTRAPRIDAPTRSSPGSVPPMTWMPSRSAPRAISPSALTLRTVAPVSFAPVRSAPDSAVASRKAPVSTASRRSASRRSARSSRASVRFASRRSAPRRSRPERSCPARSVPASFAPIRSLIPSRRATTTAFAFATAGASAVSTLSCAHRAAVSRPARSAKKSAISSDISRAASRLLASPATALCSVSWRAMSAATRYSITDQ